MLNDNTPYSTPLAVGIVWLFHLSAIIGIVCGFQSWFVPKTPLNLLVCFGLFLWVFPIDSLKKGGLFVSIFVVGMLAEWLGVRYGLFFGSYAYGVHFGPLLDGVPYLIGVYWALLSFVTAQISNTLSNVPLIRVSAGASLMVLLDFFMEHTAPVFDFWSFQGGAPPWNNYVSWFLLAILFQGLLQTFKIKGNTQYALHLFLAQILFFAFLYLYL